MNEHTTSSVDDAQLLATFLLGDAAFGVPAEAVQEVVRPGKITTVHHAPHYVVGIRNLRGRIVTVVDLAIKLNLGRVEIGPESRILIIDIQGEPIGLLVDQIADITAATRESIEAPPSNVHGIRASDLRGMCRSSTRLIAILDVEAVFDFALD